MQRLRLTRSLVRRLLAESLVPRIFCMLASLHLCILSAAAQDDVEYRREIGVGVGLANYVGDFNGSLAKGFQPMGSVVYRHLLSPYSAVKADMSLTKVKGTSADATSYYPGLAEEPYTFSRSLYDLNVEYEYNFWPYGTGREYRGAVRLTPYILMGLGLTIASGDPKTAATMSLPLGFGVKYKVGPRLNISLEWAFHATLSDRLDGLADPYDIKSSGVFKNTDCYTSLRLALTYSFSPKCRTCNKDE